MGCGCGSGQQASFPKRENSIPATPIAKVVPSGMGVSTNVAKNLTSAFMSQPNKFQWLKDGVTGLLKCVGEVSKYSDEQIAANRDVCRVCPHSTKKDGKLITTSQCMAPDPTKGGVKCGCIILCKSQVGECPLKLWTDITISASGIK